MDNKTYIYPLPADIHLQYLFSIRCKIYLQIPMSTNYFGILIHIIFM